MKSLVRTALLTASLVGPVSVSAQFSRAIMEGVPASNNTIFVSTRTGRFAVGSSTTPVAKFLVYGTGVDYTVKFSTDSNGGSVNWGMLNSGQDFVMFGATAPFGSAIGSGVSNFTLFQGSSTSGGSLAQTNLQLGGFRNSLAVQTVEIQGWNGRANQLATIGFMTGQSRINGGQINFQTSSGTAGAQMTRVMRITDTGQVNIGQDESPYTLGVIPVGLDLGSTRQVVGFSTSNQTQGLIMDNFNKTWIYTGNWGENGVGHGITATISTMNSRGEIIMAPSANIILGSTANAITAGGMGYNAGTKSLVIGIGSSSSTVEMGAWSSWTTTFTGFSTPPTVTTKYTLIGKTCLWKMSVSVAGTSNATNFQFTLPFLSADGQDGTSWTCRAQDNGVEGIARVDTNSASKTANVGFGVAGGAWTASGTKFINCSGAYEIQ